MDLRNIGVLAHRLLCGYAPFTDETEVMRAEVCALGWEVCNHLLVLFRSISVFLFVFDVIGTGTPLVMLGRTHRV